MTVPHQSEAPVRGRTGFSNIGGLLASVPSVSCPNVRAASLRKIVSKLFFRRRGTLATQANLFLIGFTFSKESLDLKDLGILRVRRSRGGNEYSRLIHGILL